MGQRIVSFVMSGGVGSRLWPLSREDNPKQFHDLSGDGSMLAKTLRRLTARPAGETPIFLIASERHADRVHADLAGLDLAGGGPLFEPAGRNTAAAVALATLRTLSEFGDSLVLVVPSDHEIATAGQFWQSIEAGSQAARAGRLVVFGIKPTQPETGYGYIEVSAEKGGVFDVSRFVEKPDLATANDYLKAGNFYWNTGIFLFRAGAMRDAFKTFQPDIWHATEAAYEAATTDLSGLYMPLELYAAIRSNSIDYAIMERAKDIAMVPAGFRWNDLGSWQSLLDVGPADDRGNVVVGDVVAIDCENSYIRSDGRLLSAIGMKDVAIVSTADATFVAPVSHSQHVRRSSNNSKSRDGWKPGSRRRMTASSKVAPGGGAFITGCSRRPCRCGRHQASTSATVASTRRWVSTPSRSSSPSACAPRPGRSMPSRLPRSAVGPGRPTG